MPVVGPPTLLRLFPQQQLHLATWFRASTALTQGSHGKTLNTGQAQVGIPLADKLKYAIVPTQQLGAQSKIGPQPVKCIGRADQFLIRRWHPRVTSIHVADQVAIGGQHADAPRRLRRAEVAQ